MSADTAGPRLAVVGASGLVGASIPRIVSTHVDVWGEIAIFDVPEHAGRMARVRDEYVEVQPVTEQALREADIVISDLSAEDALHWLPPAAATGTIIVDSSTAFHADADVPLVSADVNPEALQQCPRNIVANPGSLALTALTAIAPLHRRWGMTEFVVTAMIPASTVGAAGTSRLFDELGAVEGQRDLGRWPGDVRSAIAEKIDEDTSPFVAPLAMNVVPWFGRPEPGGWTSEETKMIREVRNVLGLPELKGSVSCVVVPVLTGHSMTVQLRFGRQVKVSAVRQELVTAPSVVVLDDVDSLEFPTPIDVAGLNPTFVGRLRQSPDVPRGLALFMAGDNVRRGSALNAVMLAEKLIGVEHRC